ncbi:MAG TPA: T9SS type A sorting domain-containing protein [bacterium]|jgi:hypothetical protein
MHRTDKALQRQTLKPLLRIIATALIVATAMIPLCNVLRAENASTGQPSNAGQAADLLQRTGTRVSDRLNWFYAQRAFPSGEIPASARLAAWQQQSRSHPQPLDEAWTQSGPANLAGRMLCIAWHPTNTNIIYAGSASGGLWKTTNAGANWFPLTDNLPSLAVGAVALDPSNPNIVYMGTGEGAFNVDAVYGAGIFKSTDGGTTWNVTGMSWTQFQGRAVNKIIVHPTNPQILWAATNIANGGGVFKSTDGGANWMLYLAGDARDLIIRSDSVNVLYAALGYPWGGAGNGIYRSGNGGVSWTLLTSGLPSASQMGRITLSHANGQTLYAGISQTVTAGAALLGIYRTTDGGVAWTLQATSPDMYGGQGWYNMVCAQSPATPAVVYSGGLNCYKSTDFGVSWTQKSFGTYATSHPQYAHSDQHALAFKPDDPNTVLMATGGGMFRSTNGGDTWSSVNTGLATYQFYTTANDQQYSNYIYGGAQDNGSLRGSGSMWTSLYGGDGGYCNVDFTNPSTIYVETERGSHYKSINGGSSFSAIQTGITGSGAWVTPVVMDPSNPQVLYTATDRVYKTTNGGINWAAISPALSNNVISTIGVAPSNPAVMYAGCENGGMIYRTTNGGSTWTGASDGLPLAFVTRVAVHPTDPATVYATFSSYGISHVFKSTNGGDVWTDISGTLPDVPCNVIIVHPSDGSRLYLGTDLGVYTSSDAGQTWNSYSSGLPAVVIDDLTLHPITGTLRAATHGRGIWQTATSTPALTVIAPNGGESWLTGASQNITWAQGGLGGNVRIELNRDYPNGSWETIVTSTPNDGGNYCTVTGPATSHARIRITSVEFPASSDLSNGDFGIVQPRITLLSPNGGETWLVGATQTISWNTQGVSDMMVLQINRSYPSSSWTTITSTNLSSYNWPVTGTGSTIRFRIYSSVNSALGDTSDGNLSIINPQITLLNPNGGEVLVPGSIQIARWTDSGLTGTVRVELCYAYPTGAWDTLAAAVSVDSLVWNVRASGSSAVRMRVISNSFSTVFDISDANFSIRTPSLTLNSPNGGEAWNPGTTHTIRWTRMNVEGPMNLYINRNYPANEWTPLAVGVVDADTFSWLVTEPLSSTARIRVLAARLGTLSDESNANFGIGTALDLSEPNGGETWDNGTTQTISWARYNAAGAATVQINRSYPSAAWETLTASATTNGYAWTVSGNASTTARVRVFLNASPTVGDTSAANFTITAPGLLVTSPNGGEAWPIGSQQTISWSRNNSPGNVTVQVNRSYPSLGWEMLTSTASGNSLTWTVAGAASATARVRVYLTNDPGIGDTSNGNLALLAQGLTVLLPNGGEQWTLGSPQTIRFARVNAPGAATLQLKRNYPGGSWETISTSVTDTLFTWTPGGAASTTSRIRVYLTANSNIGDTSNAGFSLISPSLTVTSPNGGELWGLGSSHTISWTRTNAVGGVLVSLNRTYPSGTWETLAAADTGTSLAWSAGGAASATARVRVTLNSVPTVMDESNASFSLVQPALNLSVPNGGSTYTMGSTLTVRWTRAAAPGAVSVLLNRTYPTGAWELLTSAVTADTFAWTSSGAASSSCRMKIRLTADSTISDLSTSNFTLQVRSVVLTAPNGGEALYTGSTTPVTFVRTNASTNVTVQLNRTYPSGNWETLATTVSGSSFTWSVSGAASNSARIRAFLTAEPAIGDTSNSNFVIVIPTLTLTAPNGGDVWAVGSSQNIIWQRSGMWDNVRVELKRNYPAGTWETLAASASGNFLAWTVTGPATGAARVRVVSTVTNTIGDTSASAFSITSAQITLTTPNGGETATVGAPYVIRFNRSLAAGDARVMLNRTYPAGTWETLGTTTADTLAWSVTAPAGNSARIKVYLLSDATVGDTSASNFTILQPSITLTAPNGGEVLRTGAATWISWTRSGVSSVDVLVNRAFPSGTWETLAQDVTANQYAWTAPNLPSLTCRIKVQSHTDPTVYGMSAMNFELQKPQVMLTYPAPGDTLAVGVANTIRWSRNTVATDTVRVELNLQYPSDNWAMLETTTASAITWIALSPPTSAARLRVVSVAAPEVSDTLSGDFAILPAALMITSPATGDSVLAGHSLTVSWTRDNVSTGASLYLCRSGSDGPWETLASDVTEDSWSGIISGPRAPDASLRVVSTRIPALADTVGSLHVLVPAVTLTSPNAGAMGIGTTEVFHCLRTDLSAPVSFDVTYHYPSGPWYMVAIGVTSDSFSWSVPDSQTTHARVRVRCTSPSLSDLSDNDISIGDPHLALLAPSGGDSLVIGQSYAIRWLRTGAPGLVKVELNRVYPDSAWTTLAAGVAPDSFGWTVSGAITDRARVRVSLAADATVGDSSNSDLHLVQPSLVLLSPVAGDSLALTLPAQIRWGGVGSNAGVTIQLMRVWPAGSWETLASNVLGNTWTWTASGSASETARFRIVNSHNSAVADTTDGAVRIGQASFVFSQPQAADTFLVGDQIGLAWNRRFAAGFVRVDISRGGTGGPWEQIGTTEGNTMSWTVTAPVSNIVRFRITSLNASWIAGMTPFNCTILSPALAFTSPSGSGTDTVGNTLQLAWQWSNFSGAVRLEVSRDSLNGTWQTLADSLADPHYTFPVTEPETDSLRFRVTSLSNSAVFGFSPVRRVIVNRSIALEVDGGGSVWYIGQQKWIHWTRTNCPGTVNLEVTNMERSQPWTPLAQTTADSFLWTVSGPEADFVALRVAVADRPTVMDTTDTPVSVRQPYIDLLEPNGGDTLIIGQDIRLRWVGVGFAGDVAIGLYRGAPVDRIDTLFMPTPNDSSQIWHVAGPAARGCMVIILSVSDSAIFDTSAARFVILDSVTNAANDLRQPREYALAAPYPNPFNSTSTLEFSLPHDGRVTLTVYDLLGREVAVLANDIRRAGTHRISWNAQNVATGAYFVRMQSGSFVAVRKLQLIK